VYPSKCVFWNTVMATYAERGLDELPRIPIPRTPVNRVAFRLGSSDPKGPPSFAGAQGC
jgi:hypothetical protein